MYSAFKPLGSMTLALETLEQMGFHSSIYFDRWNNAKGEPCLSWQMLPDMVHKTVSAQTLIWIFNELKNGFQIIMKTRSDGSCEYLSMKKDITGRNKGWEQ